MLPRPLLNLYFSFYPFVGSVIWARPSRNLNIVGITGTDGKSSTVIFTARILREAGYKAGFFSSVAYSDGDTEQPNTFKMTMPGRFFMQRFLKNLVEHQCNFGVIEVTSEGIKQKRHLFIDFDTVAITNLKPEHIESHGGFNRYKEAKATIFKDLMKNFRKKFPKTIVVNADDDESKEFLNFDADQKITFGIKNGAAIHAEQIQSSLFETRFTIRSKSHTLPIQMKLGGPFFVENAIAAVAIAQGFGTPLATSISALEKISHLPGRFEIVSKNPLVIVDYAHTVAAVEEVLSFIKKNWGGRIVHVFGAAGGGRDKWKRPHLAALSEQFSDLSILTEENPFDEPTELIMKDIYDGFKDKKRVLSIPDRREAVKKALSLNEKNTLFLFTGKGCETVIAGPRGTKKPYNEKEAVLQCLASA